MKITTRIFIGLLLIYSAGFYYIIDMVRDEIRPRYLEAVEESLNDTAAIIASQIETEITDGKIHVGRLKNIFEKTQAKRLNAQIYGLKKTRVHLHVYVTDKKGIVLYDSKYKQNIGMNFSMWNDVYLTLKGKYGARSTRLQEEDPSSSTLYISAPIRHKGNIIGVVTISKPTNSLRPFMKLAIDKVMAAGILVLAIIIVLTIVQIIWINRPISQLTRYVKNLKTDTRTPMPAISSNEIKELGTTFKEMYTELLGKKYIEQYIQTLTHEIKSPLSSIRGAAELLQENIEEQQKQIFHKNIERESKRISDIINRLLQLSSLENRDRLNKIEAIPLHFLLADITESVSPQCKTKHITVLTDVAKEITIYGEQFLIKHAIINLVQNAITFSSENSTIHITVALQHDMVQIRIDDYGHGIPEYALNKIFDKFYSLPSDDQQTKGTGLGLPFVKEVADLHNGEIQVTNKNNSNGVLAILTLPQEQK